jgi:hypothetical protein
MKPAPLTIKLTSETSKGVAKLAALIAWTPDELTNHLLAETIETFADGYSGALEGFLGATSYPDRRKAQRAPDRVTQMNRTSLGGQLPKSFKAEIFESGDGRFDIRAEYTDRHTGVQSVV